MVKNSFWIFRFVDYFSVRFLRSVKDQRAEELDQFVTAATVDQDLQNANGFIIVYKVNDPYSFKEVARIKAYVRRIR